MSQSKRRLAAMAGSKTSVGDESRAHSGGKEDQVDKLWTAPDALLFLTSILTVI